MLRVSDWLPYNGGVNPTGANSGLVIGTQFGPDGALYMSRYSVGCCRSGTNATQQNQIVKISFNVQDECLTDTNAPTASADGDRPGLPGPPRTPTSTPPSCKLTATDSGCAGVKNIEYRQQGSTDWLPYTAEVTFDEAKTYNVEYRATDRKDNVSAVKTATFEILQDQRHDRRRSRPADASGNKDQRDYFVGSATLTLTATDNEVGASGVQPVEYRTNGGAWTAVHRSGRVQHGRQLHGRLPRHGQGQQHVRRSSRRRSASSPARAARRPARTSSTARRWARSGSVTRATAARRRAPFTFADGQLHLPTADFELDAATRRRRPSAR